MKSGERQLGKPERNGYKVGIALYFNVLEQIVFIWLLNLSSLKSEPAALVLLFSEKEIE